MGKRSSRKDKINFLLENPHYRRLHLFLYLASLLIIVTVYFVFFFFFSSKIPVILVSGTLSVALGIYLIFHKDRLIRSFSDNLHERKRKKFKKEDYKGRLRTLKSIRPKSKASFKIKAGFKDRMQHFKKSFKRKGKQKDYIEIE